MKIAAVSTIKFRLYDTALHRSMKPSDVRIDGNGVIWYNNSNHPQIPLWEPLNESGEGCYLKDVRIKEYDSKNP
jgi:hypothetical protein